jgi:hypothetical protein
MQVLPGGVPKPQETSLLWHATENAALSALSSEFSDVKSVLELAKPTIMTPAPLHLKLTPCDVVLDQPICWVENALAAPASVPPVFLKWRKPGVLALTLTGRVHVTGTEEYPRNCPSAHPCTAVTASRCRKSLRLHIFRSCKVKVIRPQCGIAPHHISY